MPTLNEAQRLLLSQAGFTDRQISEHVQKLYNLFNTKAVAPPLPMKPLTICPRCGYKHEVKEK